jgi:hypothetical protein
MKAVTLAFTTLIVGVSALLTTGSASAQSFGTIARQEEARRKTISTPSKVITNRDLKPVESPIRSSAPATVTTGAAVSVNLPPEPKYMARDASYWLNRMRDLQTRLDRSMLQAAALQNRADSLSHDFDSTGFDRSRRSTIDSERQMIRTELELVKAEIAATGKQIFDLEDEARRSNVPPGWLRP